MTRFAAAAALLTLTACATATSVTPIPIRIAPPSMPEPMLAAALDSAAAEERERAAWQLAGAPGIAAETADKLRRLLYDDPEEQVRLAAAWALGHSDATRPVDTYDTPPERVAVVKPTYPDDAFHQRIQGTVLIEIIIGERGKVAHGEVRESIPALDAAALACVRGWSFKPAQRDGRPIPTVALAPVVFRIY